MRPAVGTATVKATINAIDSDLNPPFVPPGLVNHRHTARDDTSQIMSPGGATRNSARGTWENQAPVAR